MGQSHAFYFGSHQSGKNQVELEKYDQFWPTPIPDQHSDQQV